MVKVFLQPYPEIEIFQELSYRAKLEKITFNSSWVITILGIVELLAKIRKTKNSNNNKKLFFDRLWFKEIKERFKVCKKNIARLSAQIAMHPQIMSEQDHIKCIVNFYSKVIDTKPRLIEVKLNKIVKLIKESHFKKLSKHIKRASTLEIKLIRNFPITLVSKGVKCFAERLNKSSTEDVLKNFKCKNRILVFFESKEILGRNEIDKYFKAAENYSLAEIYSYTVFTTLEYEVVSFKEFVSRKFVQALFAVCKISTCDSEFMMPVVHPTILFYYENNKFSIEEEKEIKAKSKGVKRNRSNC